MNRIVLGENLAVLRGLKEESVELIYVDPPFNTGKRQVRPRMKTVRDEEGGPGGVWRAGGTGRRRKRAGWPGMWMRSMTMWGFCGRGWWRRDGC